MKRAAPLRSLDQLGALAQAMRDRERLAAEQAARERERAAREQRERDLFSLSVGPVVPLRRGVWAIQAQLDLHGLRRDEARERLAGFLRESGRAGLRCVRVIHGKGNGSPGREPVLKGKVRSWLVQKSEVIAFAQARAQDGGHGALLVLLRPQRHQRGEQGH